MAILGSGSSTRTIVMMLYNVSVLGGKDVALENRRRVSLLGIKTV